MPRHPLIDPLPDAERAGRRMTGGFMTANSKLDGRESSWMDRHGSEGYILAGYQAVGIVLDGTTDIGDGAGAVTPVRLEHVLDPADARARAYELMVAADIAERLQRGQT